MTDALIEQVLGLFTLNEKQRKAALERGRDVVVTAGAGSGKTSTLVARYVCLLAEGVPPRRLAAITFTKKAAREMRSRVRGKLMELQQAAGLESERQKWVELSAQMDSARIGTIHSLCSEILRAHPAEAGVDPRFEVLDEGLSAALLNQAVEDTLITLVEQEQFLPLLKSISTGSLKEMLQDLLKRRLEAGDAFEIVGDQRARLASELRQRMGHPLLSGLINDLRGRSEQELFRDAGDKLAEMVKELLQLWRAAEEALDCGDPVMCAGNLFQARREKMKKTFGKRDSTVKETIAGLQAAFDSILNPLTGGKNARDAQPNAEAEALFEKLLPLLREAFELVHRAYKAMVESRQALDFDDLEYGAQQLLRREEIRMRWQAELDAVLVDEFQDTNQHQREIVEALTGSPGRLFVVGDMRQSIYRFRRADVTVFKEVQENIDRQGGLLIDLDKTYRAHEPLLAATGDLLSGVIGTHPDPERSYYIPYTPLVAEKKDAPEGICSPHVEFVLGAGEDSEAARPLAARALAERLRQLKNEGQVKKWDEVALLFRAATGFPFYEEALEEAGIPFVTVAGKGFYDRPEIRDLVNILRALADPLDDLSFAGLLRSPAFGLSDAALFLLRQGGQSFWTVLQGDLPPLTARDQACAERARHIVSSLLPLVDRVPVAELLKRVVDAVDYRAILATADMTPSEQDASLAGGRLWRNLDKLLEDAQVSQQVNVRDFLDLLETLNDAGAREGEAPAEAEGTVRLMTIHKSKGLEFPVVVLANAGGRVRSTSEQVYLSDDLGVTFKLDPEPMLFKLAKAVDKDQNDMEALRLLYVALTRAKSKLIISAHATYDKDGVAKSGAWAEELVRVSGLLPADFQKAAGEPFNFQMSAGNPVRAWCAEAGSGFVEGIRLAVEAGVLDCSQLLPLYQPLEGYQAAGQGEDEEGVDERQFCRAARQDEHVPGEVLGKLVHKAIQRWLFPPDPRLTRLLEAQAFNAGLVSEAQRSNAVSRALELLERLGRHAIRGEIDAALERHAELPYTYQAGGRTENRFIDLLYRDANGWHILDFKTDPLQAPAQRDDLARKYAPQLWRYRGAVKALLGVDAGARICFLDDRGRVVLVEI